MAKRNNDTGTVLTIGCLSLVAYLVFLGVMLAGACLIVKWVFF